MVNAATRDKDLAWITEQARAFDVQVSERPEFGMIAVQGPNARDKVLGLLREEDRAAIAKLGKFVAGEAQTLDGMPLFVARTGYTGEDGFEVIVPRRPGRRVLECAAGRGREASRPRRARHAAPGGRHEPLWPGHGRVVSPYEAALAWTVALDEGRDFIGRDVLEAQKASGAPRQMIGLVMDEKGVLRHGQKVLTDHGDGEILSGTFSPTLGKAIAFARVPAGDIPLGAAGNVRVDIRGKEVPVRVVKFPFVRDGKAQDGI